MENGAKSFLVQPYSYIYLRIISAFKATKETPCVISQSASAAVANSAVISAPGESVIFSTPTATAVSIAPEATANRAVRKAAAPELQADSNLKDSA